LTDFETIITQTITVSELLRVTDGVLKTPGCSTDKDQHRRTGRNKQA